MLFVWHRHTKKQHYNKPKMKSFVSIALVITLTLAQGLNAVPVDEADAVSTPKFFDQANSTTTQRNEVTTNSNKETTTVSGTTAETITSAYRSNYHNQHCNFTACVEPTCQCLNDLPPKGLIPEQIPQFVTITFDGAVTVTNFPYYKELLKFKNPSGCPIQATYFVSHVDTNYKLVHELYRHGNDIGSHSISKSKNNYQDYWKNLDYDGWRSEFGGQRRIISKFADIPIADIKGARAPNLQTAGNITIAALVKESYQYDCSSPSRAGIKTPFFPYTMDYGFQRDLDCPVEPCPSESQGYPDFWDVPMNDLEVEYTIKNESMSRECATAAGCILFNDDGTVNYKPTEDQIFQLFEQNFQRYYKGNRAPFPLFLSEDWMKMEEKRKGLYKFIKHLEENKDVYFVSIAEVIEWMQKGSTKEEYTAQHSKCHEVKETACAIKDLDGDLTPQLLKHCDYEKIGELDGQTKRMFICEDVACPTNYPWVNREG